MKIEDIKHILKNKKAGPSDINKYFAVLVPLLFHEGELHVIYQIRSHKVKRQPGEISFPGGEVEVDEKFIDAAVRETYEEIGAFPDNIEIIGELDYTVLTSNFFLYPYVGLIKNTEIKDLILNKDEVQEIFAVPLKYLLEYSPELYDLQYKPVITDDFPLHKIPNGENYNWRVINYPSPFYEYDNNIIWGLTAKITKDFLDILKEGKNGL